MGSQRSALPNRELLKKRTVLNRLFRWIVLPLIVLYLCVCVAVYLYQERLIFKPNQIPSSYKVEVEKLVGTGMDNELAIITVANGQKWAQSPSLDEMLPVDDDYKVNMQVFEQTKVHKRNGVVFFLHGNKGNIELCCFEILPFLEAGYDVCTMDYRGFGKSVGSMSSDQDLTDDASEVYKRLLNEGYSENEVVLWGRSLGSGPAAFLAKENNPCGLVLESPYYSFADLATNRYPYLPGFLNRYKLTTCDYLEFVKCPVTLIHGEKDENINCDSSTRLLEILTKCDNNAELLMFKDGTHHIRIELKLPKIIDVLDRF